MQREVNKLNNQIVHLGNLNSKRLEEIDRLRAEIDQQKLLNEVTMKYILLLDKKLVTKVNDDDITDILSDSLLLVCNRNALT